MVTNLDKEALREVSKIANIVNQTKRPVEIRELDYEGARSNLYGRIDRAVQEGLLKKGKGDSGYLEVAPTLKGYSVLNREEEYTEVEPEHIFVIWIDDEVHYTKEFPTDLEEFIEETPDRVHIEKQFLV